MSSYVRARAHTPTHRHTYTHAHYTHVIDTHTHTHTRARAHTHTHTRDTRRGPTQPGPAFQPPVWASSLSDIRYVSHCTVPLCLPDPPPSPPPAQVSQSRRWKVGQNRNFISPPSGRPDSDLDLTPRRPDQPSLAPASVKKSPSGIVPPPPLPPPPLPPPVRRRPPPHHHPQSNCDINWYGA